MQHIGPTHFLKFCLIHFQKKLTPFYFSVWMCFQYLEVFPVFGGVDLVFGGVSIISMNVFRPMFSNVRHSSKTNKKGLKVLPIVLGGLFDKYFR